jgi:hypothetical protein
MSEQAAIMVDTFLRIAGVSLLQSTINAFCLLCAGLLLLLAVRLTSKEKQ